MFLDLSAAKLHLWEQNQIIENRVWMSVFNLLTNSMSVNGQVYDIANRHAGFLKHFICKETLSHGDSPTWDQDISRIKYTRGANFTKLCRCHRETSTTNVCGQWPISTLDFVNITSARKPLAAVVHLLGSKTSAVTSTHAVLILQIYVGAIENRVPPVNGQVHDKANRHAGFRRHIRVFRKVLY